MRLTETLLLEGSAPTAGVIPGVKILGAKSRNRREYTADAMKGAVSLYEGAVVYTNHAPAGTKHRSFADRFGRLRNVRFDEAKCELRGDLEYLETHPAATQLKEDVERRLNFFGLSHDADGQFVYRKGVKTVTQIDKVNSVDLVSNPATNISLLEQEDMSAAGVQTPDPKVEALRGGIMAVLDKGGDLATVVAAIEEFLSTFGDSKEEGKEEEGKEGAKEQTEISRLTEQLATLTQQVEQLKAKPKKYVTAPPTQKTKLTEGTTRDDAPPSAAPKDKAALRKWLTR